MPYCSRCGVEADEGVEACPLCAAPIQSLEAPTPKRGSGPYPQHIIDPEDTYRLSRAERRRIAVELLSLAGCLASAALFLVDLLPDAHLGWSRYAVASIALGWIASIAPLVLYGRPKAWLTAIGTAGVAFLFALDVMDGSIGWSLTLGAPITLVSYAAIFATAAVIRARSIKGLNTLGIGALGLAFYLIALEAIIRLGLRTSVRPYWSIVAALALVPVAIFLFYLHGRVLRGADLRKIFRL
ncbi:MAG: hypothetical protein CVV47_13235 [Spirochaetae bacterium HGW-Spirochaetae-3]|jgi:hypothetical protein|nr:MAG: hypothetical protein CVV47_13235 [Spirochaetae bacterium HGW-Spirochaetae-3]